MKHFSLPTDDENKKLNIYDVATDMNDNIYVLARLKKPGTEISCWVYQFSKTAELHHEFLLREGHWVRLSVSDGGKVLLLRDWGEVNEYEADGQFVRSFGEEILKIARDITAANDGRVMVVDRSDFRTRVHVFSEDGDHLNKFKLQRSYHEPRIAFHRGSEHVVVAGAEEENNNLLHVGIYTKDGEFVRSTQIHEEGIRDVTGITVTTEGRIAIVTDYGKGNSKVLVL